MRFLANNQADVTSAFNQNFKDVEYLGKFGIDVLRTNGKRLVIQKTTLNETTYPETIINLEGKHVVVLSSDGVVARSRSDVVESDKILYSIHYDSDHDVYTYEDKRNPWDFFERNGSTASTETVSKAEIEEIKKEIEELKKQEPSGNNTNTNENTGAKNAGVKLSDLFNSSNTKPMIRLYEPNQSGSYVSIYYDNFYNQMTFRSRNGTWLPSGFNGFVYFNILTKSVFYSTIEIDFNTVIKIATVENSQATFLENFEIPESINKVMGYGGAIFSVDYSLNVYSYSYIRGQYKTYKLIFGDDVDAEVGCYICYSELDKLNKTSNDKTGSVFKIKGKTFAEAKDSPTIYHIELDVDTDYLDRMISSELYRVEEFKSYADDYYNHVYSEWLPNISIGSSEFKTNQSSKLSKTEDVFYNLTNAYFYYNSENYLTKKIGEKGKIDPDLLKETVDGILSDLKTMNRFPLFLLNLYANGTIYYKKTAYSNSSSTNLTLSEGDVFYFYIKKQDSGYVYIKKEQDDSLFLVYKLQYTNKKIQIIEDNRHAL